MADTTLTGLVLSDDLLFASRISGTATSHGIAVRTARSPSQLVDLARQNTPTCVVLDLANPGLDVAELLRQLREACSPVPFIVAYGSHVDTATLRAARAAGCDVVMPRSQFVEQLPTALPEWFSRRTNGKSAG